MINLPHPINESEEKKLSPKDKTPTAEEGRERETAKFLYDIAKLAFGAAITASCFKGEVSGIFASLFFAVMVALTALIFGRKDSGK